jgi:hypothetical protein
VARLEVEAYARIAAAGLMLVSGWACATPVEAPDAAFYRGGTLRIVVGFPAGLQIAPVTGDALAEVLRSAAAQPRLLAEIRSGMAAP